MTRDRIICMGEWRCSTNLSELWCWVEVCGQLHTLATLPSGMECLESIKQEAGWSQSQYGHLNIPF